MPSFQPNMDSPVQPATTCYTIGKLVNALAALGIVAKPPATIDDAGATSAANLALESTCKASANNSWAILHSGPSDYLLTGPVLSVSPLQVTQAIVKLRASQATEEGVRGRFSGGFTCTCCSMFNLLCAGAGDVNPSDKWYTVTVGREVGVFLGNQTVFNLTNKISGNHSVSYNSQQEAQAAFDKAKAAGAVKRVTLEGIEVVN